MSEHASSPAASVDKSGWFVEQAQPHESAVKAWLRVRCPWLMDVDDVTQEAYLRLWQRQSKPGAVPLKSAKAALFAIAHNAAVDIARRRTVIRIESVTEMEDLSVLDEGPGVADTVCAREELEFFAEAMRHLPTRCRQVVTLAKMYGFTEKEVAAMLGISENTVRTQVVRGMERCHAYLLKRGMGPNRHENK